MAATYTSPLQLDSSIRGALNLQILDDNHLGNIGLRTRVQIHQRAKIFAFNRFDINVAERYVWNKCRASTWGASSSSFHKNIENSDLQVH